MQKRRRRFVVAQDGELPAVLDRAHRFVGRRAQEMEDDEGEQYKGDMAQVTQACLALVGKRARELSPKHLHLAVFSTERPGEPWAVRLEAWNTTHPHWAYLPESRSNFTRDSLTAKRRLLLQEYE